MIAKKRCWRIGYPLRMFELQGITKSFSGNTALRDVGIAFQDGASTALIGPSGCGKSTLLRILVGLIEADRGHLLYDGREVAKEGFAALRQRIGYVIQEGGLFPHLTAFGNLALMPRFLGWEKTAIRERIAVVADLTLFPQDGLSRYPMQLSGGQRQRVSLMRALMLDPPVLLLDEPLGALDPMIRSELQRELKALFHSLGKTVIFVTHDLAEAAYLADRIVLLREGRVVQVGSIEELMREPADAFVTKFIEAQRGLHEVLEERRT